MYNVRFHFLGRLEVFFSYSKEYYSRTRINTNYTFCNMSLCICKVDQVVLCVNVYHFIKMSIVWWFWTIFGTWNFFKFFESSIFWCFKLKYCLIEYSVRIFVIIYYMGTLLMLVNKTYSVIISFGDISNA